MPRFLVFLVMFAGALSTRGDCYVPLWREGASFPRQVDHVIAADLDGSGRPDIVANNATTIMRALNDGTGGLGAPADVYSGTIHGSVVAAELTGDSSVDLLFASPAALVVLPGNGDGTFGAAIQTPVTITMPEVVTGRFDPDLALDVATYDPSKSVAVIYSGNGAGGFTETLRIPVRAGARTMDVANLDADGWTDVIVGYSTSANYDVFYGTGNTTFGAATQVRGRTPQQLRAADMDGNGLPDLTVAYQVGFAVIRNLGSRAFGDPLSYGTDTLTTNLATGDLTGDGIPDAAVSGPYCGFTTWTGSGTGSLLHPWVSGPVECWINGNIDLALADFDGDGRDDVVQTFNGSPDASKVTIYRNACGDTDLSITAEAPLISVGQDAVVKVTVMPPQQSDMGEIVPTGTVTLRRGDMVAGTGTLSSGRVAIVVKGLPAGEHSFTAEYSGDSQYEPGTTGTPLVVRVTAETTTTKIIIDPPKGVYGVQPRLTVRVTSSTGSTPSGSLEVRDTAAEWWRMTGSAPVFATWGSSTFGTHTFTARYAGDANHPPSSATVTYEIGKQTPRISLTPVSGTAGASQAVLLSVLNPVNSGGAQSPTGTVTLQAGTAAAETKTLTEGYPHVELTIPALPAGQHWLRVSYSGDEFYTATETLVPYTVFAAGVPAIDARGTAGGVVVTWNAANFEIIDRRRWNQAWGSGGMCCTSSPPWVDGYVEPETVYLYRTVRHSDSSIVSPPDVAMRIAFTDDPLLAGMKIRVVHMQEIVRAANILRTAAGLPLLSTTGVASGGLLTAARVNEVRSAINQARSALGAPPFPFAGTISRGTPILAAHLQELREAIR